MGSLSDKVLVTGAAGFIGSHLTDLLLKLGYEVVGVDNLSAGRLENLDNALKYKNFKFIRSDILLDDNWVQESKGSSLIFHFAANPEVRHSVREPMSHYEQNLTVTMKLLEFARENDIKLFVFASSSTVYGDPERIPTPEDHPLRPISVYGATKASAEIMCQTYARLYGMKCLILRYANIVGPRLRHGVIHDFLLKLRSNREVLEILGDGTQRKSYLWVGDAIDATARLTDYALRSQDKIFIYNVGNDDWTSVIDIAKVVVEVLGLKDVKFIFRLGTPDGRGWLGDVKLMLLDISKLKKDLGWKPSMSSLEAVKATAKSLAKELKMM